MHTLSHIALFPSARRESRTHFKTDMNHYPLFLDLTGRLVVIVGAGKVGRRKSLQLIQCGARVRFVDPAGESDGTELITEAYQAEHLEGATLVFAAATPEINSQVVADARARGIWVNAADDPETGNFIVPAVLRKNGLTIAVSTGGDSPAIAKRIRESLDGFIDETWLAWLDIHRKLRPLILEQVPDPLTRHMLFEDLTDQSWLEFLRKEGKEKTVVAMWQLVNEAVG